ncbi:class I SAM-dependent methyltransferase [Streptomyces sp. BR1]|uniref:class I SAM-dependent methyltransferase n=1 Tax=Streptomyces sp. BR1 TaxID=1592323 RepID=UPI00402B7E35
MVVPGNDIAAQVDEVRRLHPDLHELLDPGRIEQWREALRAEGVGRDDFGPEDSGGRGISYVQAQQRNVEARIHGIGQLLGLIRRPVGPDPAGPCQVVDLLGGDGLLWRVRALLGLHDLSIITCDASPHMVAAAWAGGVPALLQRAEQLLFRPDSVGAVVLAYGSHHIHPDARLGVAEEAHRALLPGGTFVLHDFLVGSPVDRWFGEVVDQYAPTGHPYTHFTRTEIAEYLIKAGFEAYEILEIDDPYAAVGRTREEAESRLGEYLVDMYGLSRAQRSLGDSAAFRWAFARAREIFRYPPGEGALTESVTENLGGTRGWRCTVPRRAVVGVGRKPGR